MQNSERKDHLFSKLISERDRIAQDKKNKQEKEKQKEENIIHWTTFYRRNINVYAHRYLGINLHPFQHIMLYLMGVSKTFFAICSRGLSKSFIVALFAVCTAMLYPYSEIVITASTIPQGRRMVEDKIKGEILTKLSNVLKYYYDKGLITIQKKDNDGMEVFFHFNQSWIRVLPALDSSRGPRATMLIYEECRLLKKTIIDSVFQKMAHPRQSKFGQLEEYKKDKRWLEECKSIYITSARFKSEWFWTQFKNTVNLSFLDKRIEYNVFAGDIFLSIHHHLKTISDYFQAKQNDGELDHRMEDLNEMLGEAEDAFFKREMFSENQVVEKAYKFPNKIEYSMQADLGNRVKLNGKDEIRFLFIDLAFANTTKRGQENDESIIGCFSLVKKNDKYRRICDYITGHPAGDSDGLDLKIREMFFDYQADYIVMDLRNGGETIYNYLTKERLHPNRVPMSDLTPWGWNSHGLTVSSNMSYQVSAKAKIDDLKSRTIDRNAIPCIIPILATTELNHLMWCDMRDKLQKNDVDFLIDDIVFNQMFEDENEYFSMSSEEKARIKLPYIMTQNLIQEAVNLEQVWRSGLVKLEEPRNGTKDIIVGLSYCNYIATKIETCMSKGEGSKEIDLNSFKNCIIW